MASVGSIPFVIDTAMESSVLLHSGKYRRLKLPFFAHRPRKYLESGSLKDLTFGSSKVVGENIARCSLCCDRVMSGCNGGRARGINRLNATVKGSGEVEDGDESEDALQATIEKSKKVLAMQKDLLQQVSNFIYNHGWVLALMRKHTNRELLRPAATRFATSYLTLQSMYGLRQPLEAMFTSKEWAHCSWANKAEGKIVKKIILRDQTFWNSMAYAIKTTKPLVSVLRMTDSEKMPGMGFIYGAMDKAKEEIAKNLDNEEGAYKEIWSIIDDKWEFQLHRHLHAAAYFLNPHYQYDDNFSTHSEIKLGLYTCMDRLIPDPVEREKADLQIDAFRRKEGLFGFAQAKATCKKRSPADWWIAFGDQTPELTAFAVKILSLTCSSSACERNWSTFNQITERRKLVSSIKNSIIDPEGDEVSFEKDSSFSNLDITSTDGDHPYEEYNGAILSSTSVHPRVDELQEQLPSAISKDFGEIAKEPEKDLPLKNSLEVDSPKQLKDTTSETVWSNELPAFLSDSATTSSLKYEKHEDLKEPLLEANGEKNVPTSEDVKPPPLAGANVMNIILVAAECAPWSKTGGLGDVAGALPKALARRGHRVMVVAPLYGNYAEPKNTGIRKIYKVDGQDMEVTYFQAYIDGVDFVFIESPKFRHIENNIYGGNRMDILKRMVLFCKAAVEVPWNVPCGGVCYGDGNLVFIANDWHTALLPVYLKAYYRDNGLMKYTRSILVIHNIAHQGRGPVDDFSYVDLPPHYLDLFRIYDPVGGEHFNIFAAGLKTADRVVTVSHGYAWELKTSEGGWGLHGIINENDWKLKGIVNGIDTKDWNPQLDIHLKSDGYANYSLETLQTGKPQCKAALQKELGLPIRDDVPLIGFIGRLDQQKGVDLIAEAVPWMMGQDVQLVMLGTGRPDLEQMLRQFENQHHDKIRGWVGFSVKMARRITAGSDILLMPSRFEPCGLNQLYAMNYGTVPVVHAVGGLRDTVQPFDPYNESGVGWTFDRAESSRLIHALGNCLFTYREYKNSWEGIQRRGMMQDLSWDNAAHNYEEVLVAAKYQW